MADHMYRSSPYDRANLIADFDSIRISLASPEKIRSWSHERITLQPQNPEFEAWDLAPEDDRYRIIAEFLRVLD